MRTFTNKAPSNVSGMTLIELLMTLSIAAIVVSLMASGNFRNLIDDSWMSLTKSNMQGNIQLARSEAVTRNAPIAFCASEHHTNCCDVDAEARDKGWQSGFIMFTDLDRDQVLDHSTETLLRIGDATPDGQEIEASYCGWTFVPNGSVEPM